MTVTHPGFAVVVLPTYNERDNLSDVVGRLLALPLPDLRVLVVDDNSPDGTGDIAEQLASTHGRRVGVMHRTTKAGLGRAYVAGMCRALADGASAVLQMDADLSHPVETIPLMLAALEDVDVVVGSRYVTGGSTAREWPWRRRALSRAANYYVDRVLRLDVRDVTSGFKAWRADALRVVDLSSLSAHGYAFQIEMAFRCRQLDFAVAEMPIHFRDRTRGRSKMSVSVQLEAALLPWKLRGRRGAPLPGTNSVPEVEPLATVR